MRTRIFIGILIAILGTGACAVPSPLVTLTDYLGPNSSVTINPYAQTGVVEWLVDGTSQMTQNSYWYRIGNSGPATHIASLGTVTVIPGMDFEATVLYSGSVFDLEVWT